MLDDIGISIDAVVYASRHRQTFLVNWCQYAIDSRVRQQKFTGIYHIVTNTHNMRLNNLLLSPVVALLSLDIVNAASWTFTDATLTVQSKGAGIGGARKDSYVFWKPSKKNECWWDSGYLPRNHLLRRSNWDQLIVWKSFLQHKMARQQRNHIRLFFFWRNLRRIWIFRIHWVSRSLEKQSWNWSDCSRECEHVLIDIEHERSSYTIHASSNQTYSQLTDSVVWIIDRL